MLTKRLEEELILQQIDLFEPSKSYMNYTLVSKSGDNSITFNCVERHSDVCLGSTFKDIVLYDDEPFDKTPILSMRVRLVSAGKSPVGSDCFYKFEGISRPYSEVCMSFKNIEFDNIGRLIGESFYVGVC